MSNHYVTQEMLEKYCTMKSKENELKAKRIKMRDQIISMLEKGLSYECGRFSPKLSHSQACVFSKKTIIESLGEKKYEWIRDHIIPQNRTTFRVVDTDA